LNIAIKKKFTNKGEMFWSRGMALLLKNYCGLKCKILKFQNNPSNNVYIKKPLTDMKRNTSINNINYNVNDEKRNISNDQYNFSLLDYHLKNKISEDNFQKISQTIIKNLLKVNLLPLYICIYLKICVKHNVLIILFFIKFRTIFV